MANRERRYIVLKDKDLVGAPDEIIDSLTSVLEYVIEQRKLKNKPDLECVIIEADWPMYESVWQSVLEYSDSEQERLEQE